MAYAALPDLRAYLKLAVGETEDDTLLTALLVRAQAFLDGPQGWGPRRFEASGDTTRRFDACQDVGEDRLTLYFDQEIITITSVTNGDGTTVTSGQYVTQPVNETPYHAIRLKLSSGVVWTYQDDPEAAISVTGRWAWSLTAPADVVQATIELAAYLYRRKDASADADRKIISPDGVVILPSAIPYSVKDVIAARRPLL